MYSIDEINRGYARPNKFGRLKLEFFRRRTLDFPKHEYMSPVLKLGHLRKVNFSKCKKKDNFFLDGPWGDLGWAELSGMVAICWYDHNKHCLSSRDYLCASQLARDTRSLMGLRTSRRNRPPWAAPKSWS